MSHTLHGFNMGHQYFKNRMVVEAQATPLTFPSGRVGPELLMYYKRLTQMEPAAIIAGPATVVAPRNRTFSLLRSDQPKYYGGLKALTKVISSNGTLPGIHLSVSPPTPNPLDGYHPNLRNEFSLDDYQVPMDKTLKAYSKNIVRCVKAGFKLLEIDMTHHSFLERLWGQVEHDSIKSLLQEAMRQVGDQILLFPKLSKASPHSLQIIQFFLTNQGQLVSLDELIDGVDPNHCMLEGTQDGKTSTKLIGIRPDQVFTA